MTLTKSGVDYDQGLTLTDTHEYRNVMPLKPCSKTVFIWQNVMAKDSEMIELAKSSLQSGVIIWWTYWK